MSQNIFVEVLEHVLNTDNVQNHAKFLQGRVISGSICGKEAELRVQYCVGGFFVEGWIDNMKIRMYGDVYSFYKVYFCHISDSMVEVDHGGNYRQGMLPRTNWKEELVDLVKQKITEFPAEVGK